MSAQTPTESAGAGRYRGATAYAEPRGRGWMIFAGIMLMLLGITNFIGGIAAIDDANFYVGEADFVFSDLNTWGWIVMLTGAVQAIAALGIFVHNQFARWLGVGFASINALVQLLFISAFPLWC